MPSYGGYAQFVEDDPLTTSGFPTEPDFYLAYFFLPLGDRLGVPDRWMLRFEEFPDLRGDTPGIPSLSEDGYSRSVRISTVFHQVPTQYDVTGIERPMLCFEHSRGSSEGPTGIRALAPTNSAQLLRSWSLCTTSKVTRSPRHSTSA